MVKRAYIYTKILCRECGEQEAEANGVPFDDRFAPATEAHVKAMFTDNKNRAFCENCSTELQGQGDI